MREPVTTTSSTSAGSAESSAPGRGGVSWAKASVGAASIIPAIIELANSWLVGQAESHRFAPVSFRREHTGLAAAPAAGLLKR